MNCFLATESASVRLAYERFLKHWRSFLYGEPIPLSRASTRGGSTSLAEFFFQSRSNDGARLHFRPCPATHSLPFPLDSVLDLVRNSDADDLHGLVPYHLVRVVNKKNRILDDRGPDPLASIPLRKVPMGYATEELRVGIVEMFADSVRMSRYRTDFGELEVKFRYTDRPTTDAELLEEALAAKPLPRIHPPLRDAPPRRRRQATAQRERGTNSIEGQRQRINTLLRNGYHVCPDCGARSATHRCPVWVVGR